MVRTYLFAVTMREADAAIRGGQAGHGQAEQTGDRVR